MGAPGDRDTVTGSGGVARPETVLQEELGQRRTRDGPQNRSDMDKKKKIGPVGKNGRID